MDSLPPGAIPEADFNAANTSTSSASPEGLPEGAIPEEEFHARQPAAPEQSTESSGLVAGIEGAASGVLGPLAPLIEHHVLGETYKDILQRQNEHPIAHGLGQAAGLVGSVATGSGLGKLLGVAGEGAATAAGLGHVAEYGVDAAKLAKEGFNAAETAQILGSAPTLAAKIGSSAVSQAAEMAILQGSDETAKMIMQDPDTSSQTALANIGLATALGGAGGAFVTGVVSPIWSATVGAKLGPALEAIHAKYGVEGQNLKTAQKLEAETGIAIPNEFKSVINKEPGAMAQHSVLSQSDSTIAGKSYQKNLDAFYDDTAGKAVETLGVSPEAAAKVTQPDPYVNGTIVGDTLEAELKPRLEAVSSKYDAVNDKLKASPATLEDQTAIADKLAQKSIEMGWNKSESNANTKFIDGVIEKLPLQQTAEDYKKFITNLYDNHPHGKETYQAARDVAKIIRETQENIIMRNMGPAELDGYNVLRGEYKGVMDQLDSLNTHLHVGKYDGPKSFLNALSELKSSNAEGVLNRLSGKTKADQLEVLKDFPETLAKIRDTHLQKALYEASEKTPEGTRINVNRLMSQLEGMSPQVRNLVASHEQQAKLDAIHGILSGLKDPKHNFSNTARTVEKANGLGQTAMAFASALTGHAGVGAAAFLGKLGFKEGTDAGRYGLLRFLSSAQPMDTVGFKSMVQLMNNTIKGETLMTKAAQNVFKPGTQVLVASQMPSSEDRTKLDKIVSKLETHPEQLMNIANSKTGHYLPDHQMKLTQATTTAVNYLQHLKPQPYRSSPLDREIEPSPTEMARYNRALDIANSPSIVMQHIKDGTLQANDIQDLNAMYPAVYKSMVTKISQEMIHAHAAGTPIPYKTRMGISLFTGQPVDSSMKQQSIMAAQPQPQAAPQPPSKGKASAIGKKTVTNSQTPSQAAEQDRSNREK